MPTLLVELIIIQSNKHLLFQDRQEKLTDHQRTFLFFNPLEVSDHEGLILMENAPL